MGVLIENSQNKVRISQKKIKQKAQAVLNALDCPDGELSIVIVDDLEISGLNRQYLSRTGPTNVIAFPMREGEFADLTPGLLGDVVISVETARREAAAAGMHWETRMTALLVHGILHLFGYDHENDAAEAEKMQQESDRLMVLIQP